MSGRWNRREIEKKLRRLVCSLISPGDLNLSHRHSANVLGNMYDGTQFRRKVCRSDKIL